MSLSVEEKQKIIKEFQINDKDTGSCAVKIALLTTRINQLQEHLRIHRHDNHSRRGLLKLVGERRHHQEYFKDKDSIHYQSVIERLGLRK